MWGDTSAATVAITAQPLYAPSMTHLSSTSQHHQSNQPIRSSIIKKKHGKQNMNYITKSMIAGGVAGCAAKTVIAPLDRVKILFQTSNPHYEKYAGSFRGAIYAMREIVHSQGYLALLQGHSATLLRIFPYASVKFMAYEQYKALLMSNSQEKSPIKNMVAGSMAGVSSVFVSYPLDLLRVRLAFQSQRTSLLKIIRTIYNEPSPWFSHINGEGPIRFFAGISNFYRGFVPTVYGMIPYAGISFLTYESLKLWCMDSLIGPVAVVNWRDVSEAKENGNHVKPQLRAWAYLTSGALSGMLAQASSYPLEVMRRNMQVSAVRNSSTHNDPLCKMMSHGNGITLNPATGNPVFTRTTYETAKWIYARKGLPGFFVGLSIGFVKVIPMFAVSFYVYEWMKQVLEID